MKSCSCKGCETQAYYDRVRNNQSTSNPSNFSVTVLSDNGKTRTSFYQKLDSYQYFNLLSEYFGVEVDLNQYGEEDSSSGC